MIVDDIQNIEKYVGIIPSNVIDFLKNLTSETPVGHYELDERVYFNIDVYNTKNADNCKFEAHKKYIDIQMLLDGEEELDIFPVSDLKVSEEYDENRDVMFFENPQEFPDNLRLKPYKFVLIYPEEAHRPQMNLGSVSKNVKKAVAKILA